jgi:RNA polymerase sigma-70 factor, ECF subfamily
VRDGAPRSELPDGALVAAVMAGQNDRFDELVGRYRRPLLRVAYSRLQRPEWAEDAVQETFLWAFKSLHTYDSRYSFRTWLWTILLNQCRRILARHARQPLVQSWSDRDERTEAAEALSELVSREDSPTAALLAKERSHHLEEMLDCLPETQADALRLRFFGGLRFQEIADATGCSLSTAKNRVRWGLVKMSELMAEEGSAPSQLESATGEHR